MINSNIEAALKAKVPLNKEKKEGVRLKVHHNVKVLLIRKKKASRQLKTKNLTYHKIDSLRKKIANIEDKIGKFYTEKIQKEEAEAWEVMKENPQFFYAFAKRKKTIIGPFISKGKISTWPVC